MDKPIIGPRETVYQNQYLEIYAVEARFPEITKTFYVSDYGPRAGVLVVRGAEVLLVRQYRLLVDDLAWEIPGGKVDAGETAETAALRECLEETGLRCKNLQQLVYFHPGLDTCQNPTYIFYATEFDQVAPSQMDKTEIAELVWVPLAKCMKMIYAGEIVDSLTMVALLAYHAKTLSDHA